ncbi:hypothetical protein THAOC_27969 [Thalassiosira oceanica]|uniref:Uncharacterized protein n=1 Tax=Thalassiosira oceanica TaxID=159749 RepID=K0RV93_THAOC|nr:hypothetical protein THAOC_27969 [Thalassiosira oceanica]|eukprot:EJK52726.1 hypothetical protein THAOC_27969 [Thalassiosira oceanica]
MNFFLCDLLRPASGVRGDDGVYPARPSAHYTLTGPLGRSVASVNLKRPSMHRRSSICPLRCARDPVMSSFSGVVSHFCGLPTSPETEYRGFGRPLPLAEGGGDGPGGGAARFAMMSSVEMAATEFNDSVGRSRSRSVGRSTSYRTVEFDLCGSVSRSCGSRRKEVHPSAS